LTAVNGRHFAGAVGLRQLVPTDLDSFAAAFIEKLASYALR
jgi:hypothetical protein